MTSGFNTMKYEISHLNMFLSSITTNIHTQWKQLSWGRSCMKPTDYNRSEINNTFAEHSTSNSVITTTKMRKIQAVCWQETSLYWLLLSTLPEVIHKETQTGKHVLNLVSLWMERKLSGSTVLVLIVLLSHMTNIQPLIGGNYWSVMKQNVLI